MEPSDETLCRRVGERDPGAFELLVERYRERSYRVCWTILRDGEAAKDVSQEAFVKLHEAAASFAGESKFSTWFYRILVNCALDHRRRTRSWRRLLGGTRSDGGDPADDPIERHPASTPDPGEAIDQERRMSQLWQAVESLSPQQRAAVVLQCREGLATREIAAALGLSEATVRVHLHRAFQTLRRRVAPGSGAQV